MNRTEAVITETVKLITELNCVADIQPLDTYRATSAEADLTFRYGWAPPIWLDRDKRSVIISFCPELIAATTAELDDDEFMLYINVNLQLIAACVARLDTFEDPKERLLAAENELIELAPTAFSILSDVQLYALDQKIVCP